MQPAAEMLDGSLDLETDLETEKRGEMEITIKFDNKEIESMLRERVTTQFPGMTWEITEGVYGNSWKAETVDLEEKKKQAELIKAWQAQQKAMEQTKLEPSDVVLLADLQKEADAMDKEAL